MNGSCTTIFTLWPACTLRSPTLPVLFLCFDRPKILQAAIGNLSRLEASFLWTRTDWLSNECSSRVTHTASTNALPFSDISSFIPVCHSVSGFVKIKRSVLYYWLHLYLGFLSMWLQRMRIGSDRWSWWREIVVADTYANHSGHTASWSVCLTSSFAPTTWCSSLFIVACSPTGLSILASSRSPLSLHYTT